MNKQVLAIIGAILLLLAIVIFMTTRQTAASYSSSVSNEIPKPRPGSPNFATETGPAPTSRGGVGKSAGAVGGQ